jgi:hypothetical protein
MILFPNYIYQSLAVYFVYKCLLYDLAINNEYFLKQH